jgi:hypothetical protein
MKQVLKSAVNIHILVSGRKPKKQEALLPPGRGAAAEQRLWILNHMNP